MATSNNATLRRIYDADTAQDLSSHVRFDFQEYPDALLNRAIDSICAIKEYSDHIITQAEEGSFDLLAFNAYNSERLYWVIMCYNGLHNFQKLTRGTLVRIPEPSRVSQILTTLTSEKVTALSTLRIPRIIEI